jgi:hypothetical protein
MIPPIWPKMVTSIAGSDYFYGDARIDLRQPRGVRRAKAVARLELITIVAIH